jgi:hypothetical protein
LSFRLPLAAIAALSAICLAAAAPASAQQAPAVNPNPSPAQLALAKDIVVNSGISRSFESMIPTFLEQARQGLSTSRPELAKDLTEVVNQLKTEFDAQKEEALQLASQVVASRMSEPELKDVATFFKSPSGQKYVAVQPYMLDDMFRQMQTWTQKLSEQIMTRMRAEMKKRGHDI